MAHMFDVSGIWVDTWIKVLAISFNVAYAN